VKSQKSLAEVNAVIPELERIFRAQADRRTAIERRLAELTRLVGEAPSDLDARPGDAAEVRAKKATLAHLVAEYHAGWTALEPLGAVLKDPKLGTADFYGEVDGKLVWLCWRLGEREVTHYHPLEEGFAARRPIGVAAQRHLVN
jgi:hypothetical protein